MKFLVKFLATGFYSGLLPKAPGTWGSLLYCLFFVFGLSCTEMTLTTNISLAFCLSICGYLVSKNYLLIENNGDYDPKEVVIDEWAGMAFALVPVILLNDTYIGTALAFLLFRIFDIAKPWPISSVEKLPGALGIMADDICAGAGAGLIIGALMFTGVIS